MANSSLPTFKRYYPIPVEKGKSKSKNQSNNSSPRVEDGPFEMHDLKTYARTYFKADFIKYRLFEKYIKDNLTILCGKNKGIFRRISEGYMEANIDSYFKGKDNISIWVLINVNKKLINLEDMIKAFAIVQNKLIHKIMNLVN